MRRRQIMNKVAIVTICLTIVIIWQRNLSPGNTAVVLNVNENSGKDDDSQSGLLPPPRRLPWLQKSKLPEQSDVDSRPNVLPKDLNVNVTGIPLKDKFDQRDFNNFEERGKFLSNSEKKRQFNGLSEDSEIQLKIPIIEETEYEIQDRARDRNNSTDKKSIPYIDRHTTLSTSESEPFVKILNKPPKIIAEIDDNDENNFANFRFQKNFQRRDEELSRNLSGSVDFSIVKVKPQSNFEITNNSRTENVPTPSENVLLKENRTFVKDDRNEFFGQMPTFDDYDLPILKHSGQSNDTETDGKTNVAVSKQSSTTPTLEPDDDINDDDDDDNRTIDETMEGVVIIGSVNTSRKYAVFSTTTEERNSLSYIFYLPLTAFAWKRIGFDSIVIIVGARDRWQSDPLFNFVLSAVKRLDCVVIFLEPRTEKSIMISQVARIFAANILRSAFPGIDNVYIITSDADLWPIYGDIYSLPPGKRILSLNSDCCAPFKHRGTTYKMLPMANVGMTVKNWRRLTRKFEESPKTIDDILTIFVQEFGTVALRPVRKGDNVGWYLDQMMISILIAKWINERGAKTVKFIPRDVGVDRIDRAGWGYSQNDIADKVDAHLLLEAHIPGVWVRITPLLRLMYGDMSQRYLWCVDYYEEFQKLFLERYRAKQS